MGRGGGGGEIFTHSCMSCWLSSPDTFSQSDDATSFLLLYRVISVLWVDLKVPRHCEGGLTLTLNLGNLAQAPGKS